MQALSEAGQRVSQELAGRYGVSTDAVQTLLMAVSAGGGTMAQFYHPELGGGGQWMRGGMTMVGDMFNSNLQSLVSNLCSELANRMNQESLFVQTGMGGAGGSWWPAELGQPSSSGGQNNTRYAYFPGPRRLAIDSGAGVEIYDTGEHNIGGVQQQQSGGGYSLFFTSQFGTFSVASLPRVDTGAGKQESVPSRTQDGNSSNQQNGFSNAGGGNANSQVSNSDWQSSGAVAQDSKASGDIFDMLARLGELREKGVISPAEFEAKKTELLARL